MALDDGVLHWEGVERCKYQLSLDLGGIPLQPPELMTACD